MSTVIQIVLGVLQIFPILKGWFAALALAFFKAEVAKMDATHKEALAHLVTTHCQIELEKLTGYHDAGKPSNLPGTVIVDDLPNVGVVQHANKETSPSQPVAE